MNQTKEIGTQLDNLLDLVQCPETNCANLYKTNSSCNKHIKKHHPLLASSLLLGKRGGKREGAGRKKKSKKALLTNLKDKQTNLPQTNR